MFVNSESVEKVGLKPLVDALTTLGLPLTPPTDEEAANLDIPRIAGSAIRHYGINMFFQVNVGLGSNNTTPYRLEASNEDILNFLKPNIVLID